MEGLSAALAAEDLVEHVVRDEATGFRYVVVCANCDNRKCMGCVFREVHHVCEHDCWDCSPRGHGQRPVSVYLARIEDPS